MVFISQRCLDVGFHDGSLVPPTHCIPRLYFRRMPQTKTYIYIYSYRFTYCRAVGIKTPCGTPGSSRKTRKAFVERFSSGKVSPFTQYDTKLEYNKAHQNHRPGSLQQFYQYTLADVGRTRPPSTPTPRIRLGLPACTLISIKSRT